LGWIIFKWVLKQAERVEFDAPRELGKHRRFKHGVKGASTTALKSRQLTSKAG
jgi:hypothetical protein